MAMELGWQDSAQAYEAMYLRALGDSVPQDYEAFAATLPKQPSAAQIAQANQAAQAAQANQAKPSQPAQPTQRPPLTF
jgi:hypothetical protein